MSIFNIKRGLVSGSGGWGHPLGDGGVNGMRNYWKADEEVEKD